MEMLKSLRRQHGWSQKELAGRLGVSRGAVAMWESGRSSPDADMLVRLAALFGTSVDTLLGASGAISGNCRFPVIGSIDATSAHSAARSGEMPTGQSIDVPASWLHGLPPDEFFVLRASGSSMWPEILEDDLLLVRRTNTAETGTIAVVSCGTSPATVRRLQYSPGGGFVDLIPRNPEYAPRRVQGPDLAVMHIRGVVVTIIRDLPRIPGGT